MSAVIQEHTHREPDATGAVKIEAVQKAFPGAGRNSAPRLALDGFDLEVQPGEFLCLVGPSGCGKSTLLSLLAGFSDSDGGKVLVDGKQVHGPGPERGMLFQSPSLFPWLSTLDNVLYGPRARGERGADVRKRAGDLLETVGLGKSKDLYPHQLSGGMRHRAAFARVLVNRPRLLLMDEPFGALDAITRVAMQRFLLQLWERDRMTVVFVTHDVEEALLLGDRICVMTGTPGRTRAVFDVPFPRPRNLEIEDTLQFVHLKRQIREALEEEHT